MRLLVAALIVATGLCGPSQDEGVPEMPNLPDLPDEEMAAPVDSEHLLADLVDSLAKLPANDIVTKDQTIKSLAKTVFASAAKTIEQEQEADPMLSGPMAEISHEKHLGLSSDQLGDLKASEAHLKEYEHDFHPDQIPAEVVFAMKSQTMQKLDTDGDGLLSLQEVTAQLKKIMPTVDKLDGLKKKSEELHTLTDIMEKLDLNGDDELSKSELFPDSPKDKEHTKLEDMQFSLADENGNHKLSEGEFFMFTHPEYSANKKAYFALKGEDHLATLDLNKDTKVSWEEFQAGMQKADHPPSPKLARIMFDRADTNHDTALSLGELTGMERNKMLHSVDHESRRIIKLADDDGDGKISLTEIIKNTARFNGKFSDWLSDPDVLMFKVNSQAREGEVDSLTNVGNYHDEP
jgi:Ca2+-binding EF-hand superfamily protein